MLEEVRPAIFILILVLCRWPYGHLLESNLSAAFCLLREHLQTTQTRAIRQIGLQKQPAPTSLIAHLSAKAMVASARVPRCL